MTGGVTCSAPTAQATVSATTAQALPFVFASGSTAATCGTGPVPWTVVVLTFSGHHSGPITVNALMTGTIGGFASGSGQY